MCEFDPKNDSRYIDPCMVKLIDYLRAHGIETVSCCCGHGKYPPSVIVRTVRPEFTMEIFSGILFEGRKKRYYRKDAQGVYHIPEAAP
jgi:hypothetical protein